MCSMTRWMQFVHPETHDLCGYDMKQDTGLVTNRLYFNVVVGKTNI